MIGGLAIFALALRRVRSTTALRQLRWIVWGTAIGAGPFICAYAMPFAFGAMPSLHDAAHGHAARHRAAGLRLGHRPLPADGRRRHPQAPAGLHRRGQRHRGDLHRDRPHHRRLLRLDRRRPSLGDRGAGYGGRAAAGAAGEGRRAERHRARVLPRPLRLSPRAGRLRPGSQHRPRSRPAGRTSAGAREGHAGRRSAVPDVGHRLRRLRRRPPCRLRPAAAADRPRFGGGPAGRRRPRRPPRRSDGGRPAARRGGRVLARHRALLLRALCVERGGDRGARRWAGARTASR